ncbi:MAG: extracellular solute-binding protein [Anaerolineae bacterium]
MRRIYRVIGLLLIGCSWTIMASGQETLSISAPESLTCDLLTEITADYPEASVRVDCVLPVEWDTQLLLDFVTGTGSDLVVLETQMLGMAVDGGHLLELTDWLDDVLPVDDYLPNVLDVYGAYPPASARYYALPMMPDARVLAYRTDIFEQAGYSVPMTWAELLAQAGALRVGELIDYGFTTHWRPVDELTANAWNHLLWSYGGALWDAETLRVSGVLDTQPARNALILANQLRQTAPPNAGNFTPDDVRDTLCNGETAIVEIWASSALLLSDPATCPQAEMLAFALVPAGEVEHVISLGGTSVAVNANSAQLDSALDLLAWLQSDAVQACWLAGGGLSARQSVLSNESFAQGVPVARAYTEALPLGRDHWTHPDHQILIAIQQNYLNLAITGQLTIDEALAIIAREQQIILDGRN